MQRKIKTLFIELNTHVNAVPFMSRSHGHDSQSRHHSQLRADEGDNSLFTFYWFEKIRSIDVLFA